MISWEAMEKSGKISFIQHTAPLVRLKASAKKNETWNCVRSSLSLSQATINFNIFKKFQTM